MILEDWISDNHIPAGIGIDVVTVSQLKAISNRMGNLFLLHTFTEKERMEAENSPDPWMYYAERFAAKEAVFKALAHLTEEKAFDFRQVETLRRTDGSPCVTLTDEMQVLMAEAQVDKILISICSEGDYAIAFAQAAIRK